MESINPNLEHVTLELKALLGAPIIDLVNSDKDAVQSAIHLAFRNYWTHFPYVHRQTLQNQAMGYPSPISVKYDDLLEQAFGERHIKQHAMILGIVGLSENNLVVTGVSNPIDAYVMGFNYVMNPSYTDNYTTNFNKIVAAKTMDRLLNGSLEWLKDDVKKEIKVYLPRSFTNYVIDVAIGFTYFPHCLDIIGNDKIRIFTLLCATQYLEMLISSRSSVKLDTDYSVSTEFLTSKLQEVREMLDYQIKRSITLPILYG